MPPVQQWETQKSVPSWNKQSSPGDGQLRAKLSGSAFKCISRSNQFSTSTTTVQVTSPSSLVWMISLTSWLLPLLWPSSPSYILQIRTRVIPLKPDNNVSSFLKALRWFSTLWEWNKKSYCCFQVCTLSPISDLTSYSCSSTGDLWASPLLLENTRHKETPVSEVLNLFPPQMSLSP